MAATASIVIPTRDRQRYLPSTLAALMPQARALGAEVLVVDDSSEQTAEEAVQAAGARYLAHPRPLGANAARNSGIEATEAELIVLLDDDVLVREGWLAAFLDAAARHEATEVFAGRIVARLEGSPPRSCGREHAPVTALDLGDGDRETELAWSANMALRRGALRRVGLFDTTIHGQGEEQEWQERLRAAGGRPALYVADAALLHRRLPEDATLAALSRVAYHRGRQARAFDRRRSTEPPVSGELATLAGCVGHVARYRCPNGLTMVCHSAGRLREALAQGVRRRAGVETPVAPHTAAEPLDDFLSGQSGTVGGLDGIRRELADRADDGLHLLLGRRARLALRARRHPRRSVLALGVTRERHRELAERIEAELLRTRHRLELHTTAPGQRGKFENLRELLARHPAEGHDWLIVFDDDIELPRGFLDGFVFLAERFGLDLAQPAHRRASHAAWELTRRRGGSVVRETRFVEIGPLTAFASSTFPILLPFPPLRMGWGLEAHWAALAQQHDWRCGVVDALPINHRAAPAADAYSRDAAIEEARAFLAERPYLPARESQLTLATHRRW